MNTIIKCTKHKELFIWFSNIENLTYCNSCINEMIEEDIRLTSTNWDSLYVSYINELQLDSY
ncbi:hypothetical protein [Spiroplasma endosymbiont of Dasysyrphus albostriatus]|uniref:hypothetical protein n=1 Tax=Spiroplasma endosymbiont of Dasysyrphus albostriatus TaxID=3066299 RepID=UPI0030CED577